MPNTETYGRAIPVQDNTIGASIQRMHSTIGALEDSLGRLSNLADRVGGSSPQAVPTDTRDTPANSLLSEMQEVEGRLSRLLATADEHINRVARYL